jgi:hypothetical protein
LRAAVGQWNAERQALCFATALKVVLFNVLRASTDFRTRIATRSDIVDERGAERVLRHDDDTTGERLVKARRALEPEADLRPSLARAEIIDKATRRRFEIELDGALKRKNGNESKLAGALRALAPFSPALRGAMAEATSVMLRRGSFGRELYAACIRALAEAEDRSTTTLLKQALASDDAGGTPALSAACFSRDAALTSPLAKLAASRQSHLAFGAETARVMRGESNGAHLSALAPMIKESHRISLCVELFVPLARGAHSPRHVGPALTVLRGAERHLGRWLVLGEVAAASGDPTPIDEAKQRASTGPASARAAWSLVAWALLQRAPQSRGEPQASPPQTRPTVELVARLSDRPSADRDTTFLFRMARAGAPSARPMLEALAKTVPLVDEVAIRAALYLVRDHGRDDLREALLETARTAKRDELRGVAAAALCDLGMVPEARETADDLMESKTLGNVAWGALVRAATARARSPEASPASRGSKRSHSNDVLTETPFRWIQWGWLE